jgi:hypothetical protein
VVFSLAADPASRGRGSSACGCPRTPPRRAPARIGPVTGTSVNRSSPPCNPDASRVLAGSSTARGRRTTREASLDGLDATRFRPRLRPGASDGALATRFGGQRPAPC